MTDLSPAAPAIVAAVIQQMYDCNPEDLPNEAARIAYTLRLGFRALADAFPDLGPDEDFDFREGWQEAVSKIEVIATELENTDD